MLDSSKRRGRSNCFRGGILLLLGFLLVLVGGCKSRADKPNVVVILSDTLRASSMSLYGYPRKTTPHLSALAAESIVFDDHRAHFPGTPISVSQMFSGRLMP